MKIKSKNIKGLFVAGFFAVSSIVGVATATVAPDAYAAGQTCTWTGTAGDNKFSTAGNWSNCGVGAPGAGDEIIIPSGAVTNDQALINDLNVSLAGVTLDSSQEVAEGDGWMIPYESVYISSLRLQANSTIESLSPEGVSSGGLSINIGSPSGGSGDVVADGDFTMPARGLNAYRSLDISGNLILPDSGSRSVYYNFRAEDKFNRLIVGKGSQANFFAQSSEESFGVPIELKGGLNDSLAFYPYCIESGGMGCSKYADETVWTISGDVTVGEESRVHTAQGVVVRFTGNVTGKNLLKDGLNSEGVFGFGSNVAQPGEKSTKLEGDIDETYLVKNKETATLLGKRSYITVNSGGILMGNGTVSRSVNVSNGAAIAPGLSPGCLTMGSFFISGEYRVEIGGNTACTQYDQIVVKGNPGVTMPISIGDNTATLSITGFGDFIQKKGDIFIIIDNQTDEDVDGTFKDLPEGAEVKVGDAIFTISYKGGDGNDVVLTAQNDAKLPGVPNTGIAQILTSSPIIVAATGVVAAGALAVASRRKS